ARCSTSRARPGPPGRMPSRAGYIRPDVAATERGSGVARMSHPNPSTALATVVIDELVRAGVSVVLSAPGSRPTALGLAVERHPGAELVMTIDERSAAFNAL